MHEAQPAVEILHFVLFEPTLHVIQLLDGVLAFVDVAAIVEVHVNIGLDGTWIDERVSAGLVRELPVEVLEVFLEVPQSLLHILDLLGAGQAASAHHFATVPHIGHVLHGALRIHVLANRLELPKPSGISPVQLLEIAVIQALLEDALFEE